MLAGLLLADDKEFPSKVSEMRCADMILKELE